MRRRLAAAAAAAAAATDYRCYQHHQQQMWPGQQQHQQHQQHHQFLRQHHVVEQQQQQQEEEEEAVDDDDDPVNTKREKSRDAARHRRGRENLEFLAVARLLPLHPEIARQMDKASIIRLAVSYLKLRHLARSGEPSWAVVSQDHHVRTPEASDLGSLILQAVEGFLMILGTDLTILYISETVSIFLGQSQVDMTGNDLVSYVHSADHAAVIRHSERLLGQRQQQQQQVQGSNGTDCESVLANENICIRLRSNLGKRNAQVPISGYRTVQIHWQQRLQSDTRQPLGLLALAIALPSLAMSELYLPANSCVVRLDEDFRIVLGDASKRTGFDLKVTVPSSLYEYILPAHLEAVKAAHRDVMKLGQTLTMPVCWLPGGGSQHHQHHQQEQQQQHPAAPDATYWVQFCMNALFESKAKLVRPKAIVAVVYILG